MQGKKFVLALIAFFTAASVFLVGFQQDSGQAVRVQSGTLPVLLGAYTSGDMQTTIDELVAMDQWLERNGAAGLTFAGDFISITFHPEWNVPHELNAIVSSGFVPFVNLMPSEGWEGTYYTPDCATLEAIALGKCDEPIREWAIAYRDWVMQNPDVNRAFIAPFPEANGYWASYSSDGPTFITAFRRIRDTFEGVGVPRKNVRWVFAPNGWSDPNEPSRVFENYYPGDDYADVLAISAYNYGGCPADTEWRRWDTFETAIKPYLDRLRNLSYAKPLFLAQTGSVDIPDDPTNPQENRSQWIIDTWDKLASYPGFRGVIYFNVVKQEASLVNCPQGADYRVFNPETGEGDPGLITAMQDPRYGKWIPESPEWSQIAFVDVPAVFDDVPPVHPFNGSAPPYYFDYVHTLYETGITGGCALDPLRYCPDNPVTRAQMAVFLEKGMHYPNVYSPPNVQPTFPDTGGHWAEDWIEALKSDGITSGFPDGTYRPESPVTRAQMAVFLLRAEHGASYQPPAVGLSRFSDVPDDHWAKAWIEELAAEGITSGYPDGTYKPQNPVTRAEMSVFLVKMFRLP